MAGNSRKGDIAKSSDYGADLENLSSKGNYPPPTRQTARMEQVVLFSEPDYTDLFVQSVTDEVNGFSSESVEPVEYGEMRALFYYAVLAKLAFVTNLPGNRVSLENGEAVRDSGNQIVRVRRLDDLWVLPGAYIPVLGSIGNIDGAHPVVYRPIITDRVVDNAMLAVLDPQDGTTRLERVERKLLRMERRGLLISRGIPRTREGNPDVMTSLLWQRELYFRREGVEGLIAALAGSVSVSNASWTGSTDEMREFVMETFIGRNAFQSVYMEEDLVLSLREMARDFTRERG